MLLKKKAVVATSSTFSTTLKGNGAILSNNNRTVNLGNVGAAAMTPTARGSGKWYFEVNIDQSEGNTYTPLVGIASAATLLTDPWTSSGELMWYGTGGQFIYGANTRVNYGLTNYFAGDVISVAIDLTARTLQFYRNGVAQGSINLNTYLSGVTSFWACVASAHGSQTASIVTIPDTWKYMPSGYTAW